MGARPVTALNLVAFSLERLGARGAGRDPARRRRRRRPRRASRSSAATRSTTPSPSTAWRSPASCIRTRVVRNSTGAAGDVLFLTKPIGGGRRHDGRQARHGAAPELVARCTEVMTTLNARGRRGGAGGRAERDDRRDRLRPARPPARADARERRRARASRRTPCRCSRARSSCSQAGAARGRQPPQPRVASSRTCASPTTVPEPLRALLCDAMTSGGLLVAVAAEQRADAMEQALRRPPRPATARIGRAATPASPGRIEVD